MNLIIDIGNTRVKLGFFDESHFLKKEIFLKKDFTLDVLLEIERKHTIIHRILTNSGELQGDILAFLSEKKNFILLSAETPLPIINKYATPKTLGKDRLAGAVAATVLFPNENCLTIDCGTCITYNFINKSGEFLGGNISLGIKMRLEAMHHFTAKLPLVEQGEIENLLGDDTKSALQTGAQLGAIHEMDGFIEAYIQRFGNVRTLLTGGDADYFAIHLKNKIFALENLVLIGLNAILIFNRNAK